MAWKSRSKTASSAVATPAADHLLVEGGQEALLVSVRQPVGVAGQGRFLGEHREPGEQGGRGVGEQVIDVGDPPGAGELERQQGQQPGSGGDDPGAGVPGCRGQGGQVQGNQVRDGQQQPGPGALQPVRPGGEVDDRRGRPVACRGRGWPGRCWPRARGAAAAARIPPRRGSPPPRCGSAGCPRLSAAWRSHRWTAPAAAAR